MSESIAARIPKEMVDAIAYWVHANKDGRTTLASFGLVQRSWLSSSRFYLFRTVTLKLSNVDKFLEFLDDFDCPIASYVRQLQLDEDHGQFIDKLMSYAERLVLCAVNALVIVGLRWEDLSAIAKAYLPSIFGEITYLCMPRANFSSLGQIVHFITSYPHLERLELSYANLESPSSQTITEPVPAHLKTLRFRSFRNVELLVWLLHSQPVPALSTLDVGYIAIAQIPIVCRLITTSGPTLKRLRIALDYDLEPGNLCHTIDLGRNTKLMYIHLESCVPRLSLPSPDDFTRSFPTILSTVTSYTVKEIVLVADNTSFHSLEPHDWELMASVLASPQFACLTRICCRSMGAADDSPTEELINKGLEQCASRGILSIETCDFNN